jgi:DNA polymerase-3 subunit gamma/tau
VKFIFATTEVHKVPATILSRCQRFDFKRINLETLVETLKTIAKKEKIEVEEEVLFLLAKAADGSLRDAESLLDKLASFSKGKVRANQVLEALGLVAQEIYWKMIDAAAQNNSAGLLNALEEVVSAGKELYPFLEGLIENFRNLLIAETVEKNEALLGLSKEEKQELVQRKGKFTKEQLLWILTILQGTLLKMRRASQPRFLLEVALAKIACSHQLVSLAEITEQLRRLEGRSVTASAPNVRTETKMPPAFKMAASPASKPTVMSQKPSVAAAKTEVEATPEMPRTPISSGPIDLTEVQKVWPRVLEAVKAKKVSAGIFLSESEPVEMDGLRLTIAFPQEFVFHKETIEKKENRVLVETILSQELGQAIRLQCVVARSSDQAKTLSKDAQNQVPDIVESAIEMFQGKIIRR